MITARSILIVLVLLVLPASARAQGSVGAVTAEGAGALRVLVRDAPVSIELQGRSHNLTLNPDGRRDRVTDSSLSKVWGVDVHARKGHPQLPERPHNVAVSAVVVQDHPECPRWRRAFVGMPGRPLVITAAGGRRLRIAAKLAEAEEARWAGFQCATPDDIRTTVIVFDFHREVLGQFHMQNVPAPLDIAFVKGSGRIFSILRMDPSPTATYGPMGAYRYAIEAHAGFFKERGISPGDQLTVLESR